MSDRVVCELYLAGLSPQQAIRRLTDVVNRQPEADKRFLRIEEYFDNMNHPFQEGIRSLRVIRYEPKTSE